MWKFKSWMSLLETSECVNQLSYTVYEKFIRLNFKISHWLYLFSLDLHRFRASRLVLTQLWLVTPPIMTMKWMNWQLWDLTKVYVIVIRVIWDSDFLGWNHSPPPRRHSFVAHLTCVGQELLWNALELYTFSKSS